MATTEELKRRVKDRILLDDRVVPANISVNVSESTVTLSGTVPTYTSLRAAENDALLVPGVTEVYNKLIVSMAEEVPVPTDQEIEERIRNIYRWHENLSAFDILVSVDNGWVTLEGSVDSYWKKIIAEDLAHTASGVIDVKNKLQVVPKEVTDEHLARNIQETINLRGGINVKDLDVMVQNGTVTLNGVAETHADALAALEAATYSPGVTHVNDRIIVRRNTF